MDFMNREDICEEGSMEIRTVGIIGAGAIGAYFIAGLEEHLGENLWIIAEGERAERLVKDGIVVNDRQIRLHVKSPEEARGVDLLIVCVKYGALEEALPMIEAAVQDHTVVMSTLNGVDSEEIIGRKIGMEHMVYSIMKLASRRIGNQIRFNPEVTLGVFFGEKDGTRSERVQAICGVLDGTEVRYQVREHIWQEIWYKYALNISKNIPQAILNCGFGAYTESEHLAYISDRMRDEVVRVAAAIGVDISDPDNPAGKNTKLAPGTRFSTLQDLDAKRPTEIGMFCGTLVRMGRRLGVDTPFNEFAYHAVRVLEEKNSGKIR